MLYGPSTGHAGGRRAGADHAGHELPSRTSPPVGVLQPPTALAAAAWLARPCRFCLGVRRGRRSRKGGFIVITRTWGHGDLLPEFGPTCACRLRAANNMPCCAAHWFVQAVPHRSRSSRPTPTARCTTRNSGRRPGTRTASVVLYPDQPDLGFALQRAAAGPDTPGRHRHCACNKARPRSCLVCMLRHAAFAADPPTAE
jgi:hypothetical protein